MCLNKNVWSLAPESDRDIGKRRKKNTKWQVVAGCFYFLKISNANLIQYLEKQIIFLDKHQQGH